MKRKKSRARRKMLRWRHLLAPTIFLWEILIWLTLSPSPRQLWPTLKATPPNRPTGVSFTVQMALSR
jgi:hypothetical protein